MMHLYRTGRQRARRAAAFLLPIAAFALIALLVARAVDRVDAAAGDERANLLQSALRRAAATCYAVEGRYPADLNALVEGYGVYVDEDQYIVVYDAFAANIMPTIRVLRRGARLP